MTWHKIANMTNDGGREFLHRWVDKSWEVLGTTERHARQGEFFVFYRHDGQYRTLILSKSGERNNGACFYGSVRHYSKELQIELAVSRGEEYPGRYCGKTEKEIELWMLKEFGVPILAHWQK